MLKKDLRKGEKEISTKRNKERFKQTDTERDEYNIQLAILCTYTQTYRDRYRRFLYLQWSAECPEQRVENQIAGEQEPVHRTTVLQPVNLNISALGRPSTVCKRSLVHFFVATLYIKLARLLGHKVSIRRKKRAG